MSERKKQKPEEKVKIVIKYIAGEVSISGAAAEGGVDRKTLQRWGMQYELEGAAAFLPNRRNHAYSPEKEVRQSSAKSMDYGTEGSSETG